MMSAVLYEDRERAGSFGADAEQYDRARPSYPAALVDELLAGGARDVLDVGCGTGIVSLLLAARGVHVLGVEPDERMAVVARRHGVEVEVATFEEWDAEDRRFDLLVSGQAWHWVDPLRGAAKAAEVLRPGGCVGLFWNMLEHDAAQRVAIERIYSELAPGFGNQSVLLGGRDERAAVVARGLDETGAFGEVVTRQYVWQRAYSRDEWLDQLPTHSEHRVLPPAERQRLLDAIGAAIDGFGGRLDGQYTTLLLSATRGGSHA
jgi:SAM-dependent methyltransferase